jgi:hypothetical protein
MVVHIKKLSVQDAIDLIVHNVRLASFQATPESQKALDDLARAAEVEAALINNFPRVRAHADGPKVFINVWSPAGEIERAREKARAIAMAVAGVEDVTVQVMPLSVMP